MIQMKGKTYVCSACGWRHDEIDAGASLGPMLNMFSDPEALRKIMAAQMVERAAAALAKHETECPGRVQATGESHGRNS